MDAKAFSSFSMTMLWISLATPTHLDSPLIRLVGLEKRCQGVVQVWMENMWLSLCETALSHNLSEHICKMQSCGKPILHIPGQELNVSSPFLNVTCGLMEDIRNCSFWPLAAEECGGAAILNCTEQPVLRLSGSSSPCAGRVELFMHGVWGSVCHYGWDALDAEITCREMNCGSALSALGGSYFGSGPPQIHLSEVDCNGGERTLWECSAKRRGDCSAREHAGVICTGHREVRLSGGANNCSGRVEVYLYGVWATVCDSHWFKEDSAMICRHLGCGPIQGQTSHEHSLSVYVAFLCSNGNSLWDCTVYKKSHMCHHSKAVGLICQGAINEPNATESTTVDITNQTTPGLHPLHVSFHYLYIACALLAALLLASILIFTVIILRLQKQKSKDD